MTTRTVTATFKKADGTARKGSISFAPSDELQSASDKTIITTDPVRVTLDVNGSFTLTLLCTDTVDVTPSGWSYIVTEYPELYNQEPVSKYTMFVPYDTTPLDLATMVWT